MDTTLLITLGAGGGSLRGLVDAYSQTIAWQTARREQRKASSEIGPDSGLDPGPEVVPRPLPRFAEYFDPVPDAVAIACHMVLGAACAAMFGLTGQITGAYAAVAVGLSAPALLTQLGQVQSVNDAVAGTQRTALEPDRPQLAGVPDEGPRQERTP